MMSLYRVVAQTQLAELRLANPLDPGATTKNHRRPRGVGNAFALRHHDQRSHFHRTFRTSDLTNRRITFENYAIITINRHYILDETKAVPEYFRCNIEILPLQA
jgi:hypothetical protein